MWPSTGIIMPLSTRSGCSALAASIHSASAVRDPFDELQARLADAIEPGVEQVGGSCRAPGRSCHSGRLRRRRSRSPVRQDIRRRPAGSRRPRGATSKVRRPRGRGSETGRGQGSDSLRRRPRRFHGHEGALGRELDRLCRLCRRHRHSGHAAARQRRDRRAPATGAARRSEGRQRRGSDAQATVLHSSASAPATLPARPAARQGRASAVSGCAWLRDVNTKPGVSNRG